MMLPVGRFYHYIELDDETEEEIKNTITLDMWINTWMWLLPLIPLPFFILLLINC